MSKEKKKKIKNKIKNKGKDKKISFVPPNFEDPEKEVVVVAPVLDPVEEETTLRELREMHEEMGTEGLHFGLYEDDDGEVCLIINGHCVLHINKGSDLHNTYAEIATHFIKIGISYGVFISCKTSIEQTSEGEIVH